MPNTILVVEDNSTLVEMMRGILERSGFHVEAATEADEALEMIHQNPGRFQAVVTDLIMPTMTGIELIRQIRYCDNDMRILAFSGHGLGLLQKALEAGATCVLQKPFSIRELRSAVAELFDDEITEVAG